MEMVVEWVKVECRESGVGSRESVCVESVKSGVESGIGPVEWETLEGEEQCGHSIQLIPIRNREESSTSLAYNPTTSLCTKRGLFRSHIVAK
jgi:hypothetical protein